MVSIIARKMDKINPSQTLIISDKARELKLKGSDVISLSAGEPDFDTPDYIKESAIRAIKMGKTKYTAVDGILELKEAIVKKFKNDNNLVYSTDQISVGAGAKQCIYNLLMVTLNREDEVLIPAPYWVSYPDIVSLCGGISVIIKCFRENDFKLTPDLLRKHINKKTKWLILNSPSNPTGAVYSYEELLDLAEVLIEYPNVNVLSDDIYEHIIYDGIQFFTMAQIKDELYNRVFTVNGLSKAYAMTGWRVGYIAGDKKVIDAISIIQSQSTSNANSIAQFASVAALQGDQEFLKKRSAIFQSRRDFILQRLASISELDIVSSQGAFYFLISCNKFFNKYTKEGFLINNDVDFCSCLLNDYLVAAVPGSAFGAPDYFRISYATSENNLESACDRVIRLCADIL